MNTVVRAGQPAFDPCLLPDAALVAAGVDPATKDHDFFDVRMQGWNLVQLDRGLVLPRRRRDDAQRRRRAGEPEQHRLRTSGRWQTGMPSPIAKSATRIGNYCDVAFASTDGTILIRVDVKGSRDAVEDPCIVATRSANALDPYLPKP